MAVKLSQASIWSQVLEPHIFNIIKVHNLIKYLKGSYVSLPSFNSVFIDSSAKLAVRHLCFLVFKNILSLLFHVDL